METKEGVIWHPELRPLAITEVLGLLETREIKRICLHNGINSRLHSMILNVPKGTQGKLHYLKQRVKLLFAIAGSGILEIFDGDEVKEPSSTLFRLEFGVMLQIPSLTKHRLSTTLEDLIVLEVVSGDLQRDDMVVIEYGNGDLIT